MNYGKAIRTIRAAKGISQKDLSKKLDLDSSYLSRIEKGERTPSIDLLETTAKKLEIPFYLFMLLSSEKEDVKGFEEKDIQIMSKNLLSILLQDNLK